MADMTQFEEPMRRAREVIEKIFSEDLSRQMDDQVAKIPTSGILSLAAVAMGVSTVLTLSEGRKNWSSFVGMWGPALLFLSVYSKLVKLERVSDTHSKTMH